MSSLVPILHHQSMVSGVLCIFLACDFRCFKENMNASRPSEHPPVSEGKKCQNVR